MKEAFEKLKKWFGELQKKAEDDEEVILHYEGHSLSYEFLDGRKDAFKEAQNIVSEVEAEYGNGWIPCSERLPEKCGRYLVCNDGVAWIADFFNSTWFGKRCRYSDVIAWMPLPEAYKPTND